MNIKERQYKAVHSIENDSDSVILLLGSAQTPSTVQWEITPIVQWTPNSYYILYKWYNIWTLSNARKDGLICGVSHCSQMHIVCTDLYICIMFLLFAKLGGRYRNNLQESFVDPCLSLCSFSFGHCGVCPYSISLCNRSYLPLYSGWSLGRAQ
jgi:hypothetical protein